MGCEAPGHAAAPLRRSPRCSPRAPQRLARDSRSNGRRSRMESRGFGRLSEGGSFGDRGGADVNGGVTERRGFRAVSGIPTRNAQPERLCAVRRYAVALGFIEALHASAGGTLTVSAAAVVLVVAHLTGAGAVARAPYVIAVGVDRTQDQALVRLEIALLTGGAINRIAALGANPR